MGLPGISGTPVSHASTRRNFLDLRSRRLPCEEGGRIFSRISTAGIGLDFPRQRITLCPVMELDAGVSSTRKGSLLCALLQGRTLGVVTKI